MSSIRFSIVDVFSTTAFKGNPLAVVDDMSSSLTDTQMKLIARQFNLSETTFVSLPSVPKAKFRLRSFLPNGEEVFGQGHNSLGAWWWLAHQGFLNDTEEGDTPQTYYQQMGQEVLPVEVSRSKSGEILITLIQGAPQFLAKHGDKDALAKSLGISASEIGFEYNGKFLDQTQVVTTSPARHLLVPVSDEDVLSRVSFADAERITRELASTESFDSGVYIYTPTTKNIPSIPSVPKFQARFFSPGMSGEDPATGTASGPLAANLYANGFLDVSPGQSAKVAVLQGLKVGRECLMELNIENAGGSGNGPFQISISGGGTQVVSGSLVAPALETVF
ncbi:hypothetical protein FQN54_001677 [Arachnomyces sp. PD_36]|nr:hypothetical protein FQN54_001677 [Arachnomyces sp. PD_36]